MQENRGAPHSYPSHHHQDASGLLNVDRGQAINYARDADPFSYSYGAMGLHADTTQPSPGNIEAWKGDSSRSQTSDKDMPDICDTNDRVLPNDKKTYFIIEEEDMKKPEGAASGRFARINEFTANERSKRGKMGILPGPHQEIYEIRREKDAEWRRRLREEEEEEEAEHGGEVGGEAGVGGSRRRYQGSLMQKAHQRWRDYERGLLSEEEKAKCEKMRLIYQHREDLTRYWFEDITDFTNATRGLVKKARQQAGDLKDPAAVKQILIETYRKFRRPLPKDEEVLYSQVLRIVRYNPREHERRNQRAKEKRARLAKERGASSSGTKRGRARLRKSRSDQQDEEVALLPSYSGNPSPSYEESSSPIRSEHSSEYYLQDNV